MSCSTLIVELGGKSVACLGNLVTDLARFLETTPIPTGRVKAIFASISCMHPLKGTLRTTQKTNKTLQGSCNPPTQR